MHNPETPVSRATLYVCTTCRRGGEPLEPRDNRSGAKMFKAIHGEMAEQTAETQARIDVVPVECLSGCSRACTIGVSAPGKWSFVIGGLEPEKNAPDAITFALQHAGTSDGLPTWRERPEVIKRGVLARLPSIPEPNKEAAE